VSAKIIIVRFDFNFLSPARHPQDTLRQKQDGEKEDYYV